MALNMMNDFDQNLSILCHRTLNLTYPCVLLTVRRTALCGGVQVPTGPLLPAHRCAPLPWSPDSPSGDDMGTSAPRDRLPECPPDSALQLGGWHPAAVGRSPPSVARVAGRSLSWTLAERAVLVLFVSVPAVAARRLQLPGWDNDAKGDAGHSRPCTPRPPGACLLPSPFRALLMFAVCVVVWVSLKCFVIACLAPALRFPLCHLSPGFRVCPCWPALQAPISTQAPIVPLTDSSEHLCLTVGVWDFYTHDHVFPPTSDLKEVTFLFKLSIMGMLNMQMQIYK